MIPVYGKTNCQLEITGTPSSSAAVPVGAAPEEPNDRFCPALCHEGLQFTTGSSLPRLLRTKKATKIWLLGAAHCLLWKGYLPARSSSFFLLFVSTFVVACDYIGHKFPLKNETLEKAVVANLKFLNNAFFRSPTTFVLGEERVKRRGLWMPWKWNLRSCRHLIFLMTS